MEHSLDQKVLVNYSMITNILQLNTAWPKRTDSFVTNVLRSVDQWPIYNNVLVQHSRVTNVLIDNQMKILFQFLMIYGKSATLNNIC